MSKPVAGQPNWSARAPARVLILPAKATPEWQLYDAHLIPKEHKDKPGAWLPLDNSARLAEGIRDPEFAACRVLIAKGYSGPVETWRPGERFPSLVVRNAQSAAAVTISESARTVAKLVRFSDPCRVAFIRERLNPSPAQ